jgi:flagellar biosynthetic protein FliP
LVVLAACGEDRRAACGTARSRACAAAPASACAGWNYKDDSLMPHVSSGNAVQILLFAGGLTLIPAVLFTVTSFSRILIVLGFVRTAVGTNTSPPNQVLVGIALFLTIFVMAPTIGAIKKEAIEPLAANKIGASAAIERAEVPLRHFMFKQTRVQDISLFVSLSKSKRPKTQAEVPTDVLIPAFIVSELKSGFEIGLLIFLPFLIIDLIVSSTLMSMGMIMLPPTFISLPFKILLFVLVDGWDLVIKSLVQSFH